MPNINEYLAEFSSVGSVPTSLSGYGFGQRTHQRELSALEAQPNTGSKPAAAASGNATVSTDSVQKVLIALGYPAKGLTDGKFGKTSKDTWASAAKSKAPTPQNPYIDGAVGSKTVAVNAATYQILADIAQGRTQEAVAKKTAATQPAQPAQPSAPKTQDQITGTEPQPWVVVKGLRVARTAVPVRDLQLHLDSLQAGPSRSGVYDSQTKAAWDKYAKVFKEPRPELVQASGSAAWAWINPDAMARLRERGNRAASGGTKAATPAKPVAKTAAKPATKTSTPAPTPVVKGDMVASTADVQSLLKRLGWTDAALKNTFGAKPGALDDGAFGTTTQKAWAQSASKRKLDGFIAKKDATGAQVTVRENTYLNLKASADAIVPPTPTDNVKAQPVGGSLLTLSPDSVTRVSQAQFSDVLARVSGSKQTGPVDLQALYASVAKKLNVDPRAEAATDGNILVVKDAWNAVMKQYDAMATAIAPTPGPQKAELDAAVAKIIQASTSSVPVETVRQALNAAIQQGLMKREPFAAGKWDNSLQDPILDFIGVKTEPARTQWAFALLVNKLVTKDGKTLKLPKAQAESFKAAAAKLKKAQKTADASLKGYTKVNTVDLIGKINGLNVSTVVFDRNGGGKELADAIKTFFENTKTSMPSGDSVKIVGSDVYAKDTILTALAAAVQAAATRADATRDLRSKLVADVLKDSSATISVLDLQQAIAESVRAGKAGSNKKLYQAVKLTNAFDKATRAAYTAIAQTLTIGAAILGAEKLLQAQMGANYKKSATEELRNNVWGDFLSQAVSGTSIKTMPVIAQTITDAAAAYRATAEGKKTQAAVTDAQAKALTDAINKSTKVISLLDAQQALLQMVSNKEIDKIASLKVTGRSDKATNNGLFWVSGMIFPEGYKVAETTWANYLKAVGLNVVSDTNATKGWTNANYIALPPPVADLLLKRAADYILKNGKSKIQVTALSTASKVVVPVAATQAADTSSSSTSTSNTTTNNVTNNITNNTTTSSNDSAPAPEPTPMPGPAPQPIVFSDEEASAQPSQPLPAPEPLPEPATDAAPPPVDAPVAPAEESHTGLYVLGGVAALAAFFALKSKNKPGDKKTQMRYAKA